MTRPFALMRMAVALAMVALEALAPTVYAQAAPPASVALVFVSAAGTAGGARLDLRGSAPLPVPTVSLDRRDAGTEDDADDGLALVLTFAPSGAGPSVTAGDGLALGPWTEAVPGVSVVTAGDTLRLRFPLTADLRPDSAWTRGADHTLFLPLRAAPALAGEPPPGAPGEPVFYTLDEADRWTFDTVVLDAGHGGHDVGATANGIREKDVTLGVVRRLAPMLEALGLRVVLTRSADVFVPLRERGRLANEARGKLFVSVHVNATATGAAARGTETYILGLHKSAAAEAVMLRENAVVRYEDDASGYGALTSADLAELALTGSAYLRTSEGLAAQVEEAFRAQGRLSRGVKQAGFYVLWSAAMPSILVETGFVNDPREAAYLASDRGQAEIARAIHAAVRTLVETDP